MFFGLHARSIIFNNDDNICIKKLAPRLFSLCLNGLCQFFRSIQSLVCTQAFKRNMVEIILPNCANSTKVALKSLKLRLRINFRMKDWKRATVAYPHYSHIINNFVVAIYRDSPCRGQILRLFEIVFVTFWALYWTCFFLSNEEDFQKKKLITCIV